MTRSRRLADQSCCRDVMLEVGWQKSIRYCGAWPCNMMHSLYATRSGTSSQCNSACRSRDKRWSNLSVPLPLAQSNKCALTRRLLKCVQFSTKCNEADNISQIRGPVNSERPVTQLVQQVKACSLNWIRSHGVAHLLLEADSTPAIIFIKWNVRQIKCL